MNEIISEEWKFELILASFKTGTGIPESKCNELMTLIRQWAEEHEWGVVASFDEYHSIE